MKNSVPIRFVVMCAMVLLSTAFAGAQQVAIPKPGDPIRKTLFNAMRPAFERELKQKVIFEVAIIRVCQDWAFLLGRPLQPSQKPINYKLVPGGQEVIEGRVDDGYSALLHKINGKWKLVTYNLGATDVVWGDWWKRFHAPKAVIPNSES